jgi:energy-coupling factor transport system permease protein
MIRLYLDRGTPLHRLNPTAKLLAMALCCLAALLDDDPLYLAILMLLALALLFFARAQIHLRRLWFFIPIFFLLGLIFWVLFYPGKTPLLELGGWTLYREPLWRALAVACRTSTFFLLGLTFLACMPIEEFASGLRSLGLPAAATLALTLAFRLMPLYMQSASTVLQAQKLRGLEPERGGPLARAQRMVPLLVPTTLSALRSIDLMAMALESRGFGARRARTEYVSYGWHSGDILALVVPSLLILTALMRLWSAA